ncbi:MAG: ATP-binding protein [Clostridiales bacterium]|nr:ATP-binding protein [Clostridiales bacterium]
MVSPETTLRGEVIEDPIYLPQPLEEYDCNPFIQALNPISNEDEVLDYSTNYPLFKVSEREYGPEIRAHMIVRLKEFRYPMHLNVRLERAISIKIRRGYTSRNPLNKEFHLKLLDLSEIDKLEDDNLRKEKIKEIKKKYPSSADCLTVIGTSGTGKTTGVDNILQNYPQVIRHTFEGGVVTQIVWLKLECPHDGSVKGLLLQFFISIDEILGTNYFNKYKRETVELLQIFAAQTASRHGIGLLVIDEIQHLKNPKNKDSDDKIMNFLVKLVNTIGVPIVLIGTHAAREILTKTFRQANRAAGEGTIEWDRMENDTEFRLFVKEVMRYQWQKNAIQYSDEFGDVLYYESQGIVKVAISLFILAQLRAILDGDETISGQLIHDVAVKELNLYQQMLDDLRNGRKDKLKLYKDMPDLDKIIEFKVNQVEKNNYLERVKEQQTKNEHQNILEDLLFELENSGMFNILGREALKKVVNAEFNVLNNWKGDMAELKRLCFEAALQEIRKSESKKRNPRKRKQENKGVLIQIFEKAQKDKVSVYERLKSEGFIKHSSEFLE